VLSQPALEIDRTAELHERLGERLAQGAAEQVELAERQFGFSASFSFQSAAGFALQAAFFDPVLGETGVSR
jgi:hypothetical protein